jgi:hypothetical protein
MHTGPFHLYESHHPNLPGPGVLDVSIYQSPATVAAKVFMKNNIAVQMYGPKDKTVFFFWILAWLSVS